MYPSTRKDLETINQEQRQLGYQNFKLVDVIADIRAKEAYLIALEQENHDLKYCGLVPHDIAIDNNVTDLYDREITHLKRELTVRNQLNDKADIEKKELIKEMNHKEKNLKALDHDIEKEKEELKYVQKNFRYITSKVVSLQNEVEHLQKVMDFEDNLHRQEQKNLKFYVDDYLYNNGDAYKKQKDKQGKDKRPDDYNFKDKWINDNKILKTLNEFADQYQEILNAHYYRDKTTLQKEIENCHKQAERLQEEKSLKLKNHRNLKLELKNMAEELEILSKKYAVLSAKRDAENSDFDREVRKLEYQILQTESDLRKAEKELGRLVYMNNQLLKETAALEFEIKGYETIMKSQEEITEI